MNTGDLPQLVQGRTRFTGDLPLPAGCLHAQPAVSPHAHARFSRVDSAVALAEPGVVAVLTAADIPGTNSMSSDPRDEPLLADGEVRCVGQPFALVVADTADAAWRAARLVHADWQVLPAILDARAAAARSNLIQPPITFAAGDVDSAWVRCATVVEGTVNLGSADHIYLETQCSLAVPGDSGIVVHCATQSPSEVQAAIADATGLAQNAVEVDVSRLGGGFGGKEHQATPWAALAAVAALGAGRPVRIWLDRSDDLRITGKRHPYTADYRLGLDAEGRFVAYEAVLFQDAGCATDLSPAVLDRSLFHATNAYAIPHVRVTGISCRTNLPPNTAFRGFGAPQGIFVIEAALRKAAHAIGVAPEDLQARNLLTDGDVRHFGQVVEDAKGRRTWSELATHRDPARVRADIDAWNSSNPRLRRGMAVVPVCFGIAFTATLLNQAEALVHVYLDGTVGVTTGAVEMGQGVHGKIRRVASRTLGIDERLIRIEPTNTLRVANVSPTAASTGADLNGFAAREACRTILANLPDGTDWCDRVADAYARRRSLSALGHYSTPGLGGDATPARGRPFPYFVYGAALVEAEVDVLLGTGRVDRVTIVHDCGESLDELTDRGQIEGAVVQGIGWVTTEEVVRTADGRLLTDSLATYKVPDLPGSPQFDIHLLDAPNPAGLLNSKAVGEPPLVYGLGAFFALRDAVASYAPAARDAGTAPLTAERIFGLLHGVG